ncbi:MAG: zf-HC2 domain-containing protein [Elusimicrobiota bacterium]|jgi:anti-sigma factor RsiW
MTHDEIKKKLVDFYDGEISETERREVARHLHACRECYKVFAGWDKIAKTFFWKMSAPEGFSRKVMTTIRCSPVVYRKMVEDLEWERWRRIFARWFVPTFAVALAGFVLAMSHPIRRVSTSADELLLSQTDGNVPSEWLTSSSLSQNQVLSYLVGDL